MFQVILLAMLNLCSPATSLLPSSLLALGMTVLIQDVFAVCRCVSFMFFLFSPCKWFLNASWKQGFFFFFVYLFTHFNGHFLLIVEKVSCFIMRCPDTFQVCFYKKVTFLSFLFSFWDCWQMNVLFAHVLLLSMMDGTPWSLNSLWYC